MGELADRIDGIEVRVRAPGADIEAELRNRREFRLTFGASVYEFIDEQALCRALAGLARLLYAGWQRKYLAAVDGTGLDVELSTQQDRAFGEERRETDTRGSSRDGKVSISAKGMDDFRVELADGIMRDLDEKEFSSRVTEAASALLSVYQAKISEIKIRYYG